MGQINQQIKQMEQIGSLSFADRFRNRQFSETPIAVHATQREGAKRTSRSRGVKVTALPVTGYRLLVTPSKEN
jgi:hypothetical protein